MRRLIDARFSFENETETRGRYLHMGVSFGAEFWWDSQSQTRKILGELEGNGR